MKRLEDRAVFGAEIKLQPLGSYKKQNKVLMSSMTTKPSEALPSQVFQVVAKSYQRAKGWQRAGGGRTRSRAPSFCMT